jgi:hypothetical protein
LILEILYRLGNRVRNGTKLCDVKCFSATAVHIRWRGIEGYSAHMLVPSTLATLLMRPSRDRRRDRTKAARTGPVP